MKQKENRDGNEGSAARTRPTSVEEIMLRRKRKASLETIGAAQLLGDDPPAFHESAKGSKKVSRQEKSSQKKQDAIPSSRQERLDGPLIENLVDKVSHYHHSEKGHNNSPENQRVMDSSRKKEDAFSTSLEETQDPVGVVQLLGYDLVDFVPDYHDSEKGYHSSEKLRRVKDCSIKKEDATSSSREERPFEKMPIGAAQLHRNDLVDKVYDCHASEKGHDRSKKVRREERVQDSSTKKEDAFSTSREEKPMKEEPMRATGNHQLHKVSNYHESEKVYDSSEKLRHAKDRSRKTSREEKLDKPKKEEEPAANRKRKTEGEGSTAETNLVKQQIKDRQRKKEEANSSCREDILDKKMKMEDLAENRKMGVEGEFPTTEIKTMTVKDELGVDTKDKARRESLAVRTTEKQIHPQETSGEKATSVLESLPGTRKRLRSLVVADIPQDENIIKPNSEVMINNHNGDHKKNREKNMSKRHDPGKVHKLEVSERREKKEYPKSHQRHVREKRRRSRSRDNGQDRQKRVEKATLRHRRDHEERSENAVKDRSEKHHFNDNENKVASTVNNKSKRYSSSKSELGGYSPRKRREEASAKAASPPNISSEKKCAKWDLAPTVTAGMFSGSVFSGLQAATQTAYPTISEASLTLLKPLMEAPFRMPPARHTTSVDSVQLTESTRPMRRLYADNVPASASEKSLIECFNGYMLSSGSNHIKGSEPCISCIINKEKSQALVEFLTPQDASAALSLDGCSFAGSNLKIRRPKDFVENTSGELKKKEPATNALSDDVEDSLNKIFIGGFPKGISSEMLMEIVSVFGPLRAYRFVVNNDLNQRCAFLEYTDGSVTLKACTGLNGMKLGGSVITAVCALAGAPSSVTVNDYPPFYGIPEHAKPLLGKPKLILKLKNVVDPEDLPWVSEAEVKEILEDVRLECARFGVIKSINIVEDESKDKPGSETNGSLLNLESTESVSADDIAADHGEVVRPEKLTGEANEDHDSTEEDEAEKPEEEEEERSGGRGVKTRWDSGDKKEEEEDPKEVFEPGCILVEYGRPEATRDAAHSLHGRLYENRTVKAEYVCKELYQIRFPKKKG